MRRYTKADTFSRLIADTKARSQHRRVADTDNPAVQTTPPSDADTHTEDVAEEDVAAAAAAAGVGMDTGAEDAAGEEVEEAEVEAEAEAEA